MLTVKHITETTTFISQTTEVFQSNNGWIMWEDERGHKQEVKYGVVWVMNDHGSTVAKFDLGYQNMAKLESTGPMDVAKAA